MQPITLSPETEGTLPDEASSKKHDASLINHTLAGDYDAFEQLARRHSHRVFAIACKFFRNPQTIEDIALDTFAKAFFSLASHPRGASFEHCLAKIAFRNCYDELRRRRQRGTSRLAAVTDEETAWLESSLVGVSFELHFDECERDRATEIAEKLLSQLSPETRLILVLLHDEKRSVREIAQLMGWSRLKVEIRAFHARRELRRALQRLMFLGASSGYEIVGRTHASSHT